MSRSDDECQCDRDGGANGLEECTTFKDVVEGATNSARSGDEEISTEPDTSALRGFKPATLDTTTLAVVNIAMAILGTIGLTFFFMGLKDPIPLIAGRTPLGTVDMSWVNTNTGMCIHQYISKWEVRI